MAKFGWEVNAQAVALVAATAKTVLRIKAPANQLVEVDSLKLSSDGAVSTAVPILVEWGYPSTDGTGTAFTPRKRDPGRTETLQVAAIVNCSVEPTMAATDVIGSCYLPAFNGLALIPIPSDQRPLIQGGGRFAVRLTAPAAVNVDVCVGGTE